MLSTGIIYQVTCVKYQVSRSKCQSSINKA